jgi:DNA-binding transcriptional LysR family regulator
MSAFRISLRKLQIFAAIATHGSTAAGARALALSQSAVSAALIELEDSLGIPLFDRVGKRLMVNDEGRALLSTAEDLLATVRDIEEGRAGVRGARAPSLRLAASTTIGNHIMPMAIAQFKQAVPQCIISLRIDNTEATVSAVADFSADLGFIEGPCHSREVRVTPWLEDLLVIVAAPSHPIARAARAKRIGVTTLRAATWLMRELGSGTRDAVEQVLLPHLHHFQADMTLGSSEAIKYATAKGLGISCLSRYVVADLVAAKELIVLNTTLPPLRRRFAFVQRSDRQLSTALQKFVNLCKALVPT